MNVDRTGSRRRAARGGCAALLLALGASGACAQPGVVGMNADGRGGGDGASSDAGDAARPADATQDSGTAQSLAIDPTTATLRVTDPAARQTQRFTARARLPDGSDAVVAPEWSVDRPDVLTIDSAGAATTTNAAGGDVVVTARFGALTATAMVRVVLEIQVVAPGTPAGTAALFPAGATPGADPARAPAVVYPADGTIFPQNVHRVLFQWRRGDNDRFRIAFESARSRVVLYTDGAHATCATANTGLGCYEPSLEVWRYIAASNPRGSVTVTVDGARSAAPGAFFRARVLTIGFSAGPVPGAIYYWSTTQAGVRRGTVSGAAPVNFLTPEPREQTDGQCVACHTLSRRGNRLAGDVGGEKLWIVEVSPTYPPPRLVTRDPTSRDIASTWATFSFDETRIITAARGVLTLRRTDNGGAINTPPLGETQRATQPDWAPDGTLVAYTAGSGRTVDSGRIATLEARAGDMWGAARFIAGTGMRGDTNNFPAFSWDSQWLAYVHSTGDGKNDPTSDLWLMRRDGGAARALARANTAINDGVVTTPTVQDNMPTWAPSGVAGDYAWVAFSSSRDYGGVLARGSRYGSREQIWVAAVDLARAAAGAAVDPSAPAFRLPAQDLDENTHRPFWAEDRVMPPPPPPPPDAGVPACVSLHGACARGVCCGPNTCTPDSNDNYTCEFVPG